MCPHKVDTNVKYDLSEMQPIPRDRRTAIENCISLLMHSSICQDAFCRLTACMNMKRVVIHARICWRRLKGYCPICRQLKALSCYHARNCEETRCTFPFCKTMKNKLRKQSLMYERLAIARGLNQAPEEQEDADESEAIDVNMVDGPSFGEDAPSGSGNAGVSAEAQDGTEASSDSDSDDESGPSGEPAVNPADQPLPEDDSDSDESQSEETPSIE